MLHRNIAILPVTKKADIIKDHAIESSCQTVMQYWWSRVIFSRPHKPASVINLDDFTYAIDNVFLKKMFLWLYIFQFRRDCRNPILFILKDGVPLKSHDVLWLSSCCPNALNKHIYVNKQGECVCVGLYINRLICIYNFILRQQEPNKTKTSLKLQSSSASAVCSIPLI